MTVWGVTMSVFHLSAESVFFFFFCNSWVMLPSPDFAWGMGARLAQEQSEWCTALQGVGQRSGREPRPAPGLLREVGRTGWPCWFSFPIYKSGCEYCPRYIVVRVRCYNVYKTLSIIPVTYRHTSLYCASQILQFLQTGGLWQFCIEQVCWHHYSNNICSLCALEFAC